MGALFTAVDGVAFYHRDGALALTMLNGLCRRRFGGRTPSAGQLRR